MEYTLVVFSGVAQAAVPAFRMLDDMASHIYAAVVGPFARLIPPHAVPALAAPGPAATLITVGAVAVVLVVVGIVSLRVS
ncbi:MAG TPA: hypothetical protein VGZ23_08460 [bacterium]|nr:hypothetical protein [bacterium]